MYLPAFNDDGLLPTGTYPLTFSELKKSHLITGTSSQHDKWDSLWRLKLIENAEILMAQLWEEEIEEIFLDGSFVEDKCHPNDIDGYYNCTVLKYIQLRERHTIWDLNQRIPFQGKSKPLMWSKYRVEFYPHYVDLAYKTGIQDEFGNDLEFPSAFRRNRENKQKGIIQVIKEKK
jgi:hypothetical protein